MKKFLELVKKLITILTDLNLSQIEFEDLIDNIPKFIEDLSFKRRQKIFLDTSLCLMENKRLKVRDSVYGMTLQNPSNINHERTWERLTKALSLNYDKRLTVWWKISQLKNVDDFREEEQVFIFSACYSMSKSKYREILERCVHNGIHTRSHFLTALTSLEHYVSTPREFKDVDNVIVPFWIKGHVESFCLHLTCTRQSAKLQIKRLNIKAYPDKTTIILID